MSYLNYNIEHKGDNYCRTGYITTWNNKKIKTPVTWFGLSVIESPEFVFKAFKESKIEAFLSNAYDLLYQDKKKERHELIEKLCSNGLYHKMDSGGFQLMKALSKRMSKLSNQNLSIIDILNEKNNSSEEPFKLLINNSNKSLKYLTQEIVFEKQREYNPEISVALDFPLNPFLNPEEIKVCVDWTIDNYEKLIHLNEDSKISILPVIHGYNAIGLDYAIGEIKRVNKKFNKDTEQIPAIGIGSLVPMAKSLTGSKKTGSRWNLFNLLLELREKLPNTLIHAFGIGGTTAYLAFLCGVDSLDSTGWIQKTAYGTIQLPGISDRFVNRREHNRPYLIKNRKMNGNTVNEVDIFMKCQCSACKEFYKENWKENDWKKKQDAFKEYTQESKLKRVIHNLSLYQQETWNIRNAILENKIDSFVKNRMKKSIYAKEVDAIIAWKKGNKDIIKNHLTNNKVESNYIDYYLNQDTSE